MKQTKKCLIEIFSFQKVFSLQKNTVKSQIKKRKKHIPHALKMAVWNTWIGIEKGQTPCSTGCGTLISQLNFSMGHVIAESKGGPTILHNLLPVCFICNSSMGTKNMITFCKENGTKYRIPKEIKNFVIKKEKELCSNKQLSVDNTNMNHNSVDSEYRECNVNSVDSEYSVNSVNSVDNKIINQNVQKINIFQKLINFIV